MPAFTTRTHIPTYGFKYHGDPFTQYHLASLEPLPKENNEDINTIPVNITEDEESMTIVCEVPGLSREDIDLRWEKPDVLTIGFEKSTNLPLSNKSSMNKQTVKIHCNELVSGKMHRTIKLSSNIDTSTIQAEIKQSILAISLKKFPPRQNKVITVQIR
jgi:HSP20 family molecular chaperone IbpA